MSLYLKHAYLLVLVCALLVSNAIAQQNPERLVLKDGSFQAVTKWEIVGDRVRYYSAERYSWEELPKSFVDWPATEKYNQERHSVRTNSVVRLGNQEEADRLADEAKTPMAAPGLRLPDGGGVFLLDKFQEKPGLAELVQSGGELNKQMGKNILRGALNPLALSSKQTIELKGDHARVQSHVTQPEIFVNVNSDEGDNQQAKPAEQVSDRYRIVRLEQKKGIRIVGNLKIAVYGKVSQQENWIPTVSTPAGEWTKVTPAQPLPRGEYALVEMLDKKQINLYVWDFGVDPSAPANPGMWTPRQPVQTQTGTNDTPVLEKRPPK
ncbi:MAG TPA: hypothetical protein VHA33_16875 [Candidatus Angelobacter sp.]|jgi:hypothetical protein|nr:hypothetical protein [Candidatus Angelobacter sp.]